MTLPRNAVGRRPKREGKSSHCAPGPPAEISGRSADLNQGAMSRAYHSFHSEARCAASCHGGVCRCEPSGRFEQGRPPFFPSRPSQSLLVMRGLDPRIHLKSRVISERWVAGSSPRLSGSAGSQSLEVPARMAVFRFGAGPWTHVRASPNTRHHPRKRMIQYSPNAVNFTQTSSNTGCSAFLL